MIAKVATRPLSFSSNTEAQYASHLELLKRPGDICDWRYAPANWRLAPAGRRSWFLPDFLVVTNSGEIEWHEVKGTQRTKSGGVQPFWRGDARPKVYAAAELYPWFRWIVAYKSRNGWEREEI